MFPGLTGEEIAAGMDAVAWEVLQEASIAGPPVDANELARRIGIAVASDDCQQGRARYVRLGARRGRSSRPVILLKPEPRSERRHWALAHEIGEHVAYRVFAHLGSDPSEATAQAREALANQMAGRLLLPTAWFAADAAALGWDLFALKRRYTTASHELIARRMLELPAPAIVTIFDQGRLHFRRSNLAGRVPPLTAAETRCWRDAHDQGQPQETLDGVIRILGWPVHEDGWKREILRTEIAMEPAGCAD
jgi:Zn-dependent peptidase ImmA (M78 family)